MKTYKKAGGSLLYMHDSETDSILRVEKSGNLDLLCFFKFKFDFWNTNGYQSATEKEFKKAFNLTMKNLKQFANGTPTYD